jgi:hypothetical protein
MSLKASFQIECPAQVMASLTSGVTEISDRSGEVDEVYRSYVMILLTHVASSVVYMREARRSAPKGTAPSRAKSCDRTDARQ